MFQRDLADVRPAVVGLGYVGLPLAVEFGRIYPTTGFDINATRVTELRARHDLTLEVSPEELAAATKLAFSTELSDIAKCNVYIVTVPTPIDAYKRPDMAALRAASKSIGHVIKRGDVVVYESTVYPGATEEVCLPIIEQTSGLRLNTDFFAGYSPERDQSGRQKSSIDEHHEGDVGVDAGSGRVRRSAIRLDHQSRHAPRVEHPGCRGRQGDREHPTRSEHRADQRAVADIRTDGHRHRGSAASGRNEMELPALQARTRRRSLYRRRPVLPDASRRRRSATTRRSFLRVGASTIRWANTSSSASYG